jgi:mannose-6-phosphate isomerase-like protein (cupin superfamily)
MDAWELDELLAHRAAGKQPYLEFIRTPSLSAGLYVLARGATDRQQPHTEDEVYYVVSGAGRVTVADETRDVAAGSVIFVAATVPHRFHDIAEQLEIVVFFGPPEGSAAVGSGQAG